MTCLHFKPKIISYVNVSYSERYLEMNPWDVATSQQQKRKKTVYGLSKRLNMAKDLGNKFKVCWSELEEEDTMVDDKNVAKRKTTEISGQTRGIKDRGNWEDCAEAAKTKLFIV